MKLWNSFLQASTLATSRNDKLDLSSDIESSKVYDEQYLVTTQAVGEEGGEDDDVLATTMAVGEEGGEDDDDVLATTMAVGEEGGEDDDDSALDIFDVLEVEDSVSSAIKEFIKETEPQDKGVGFNSDMSENQTSHSAGFYSIDNSEDDILLTQTDSGNF